MAAKTAAFCLVAWSCATASFAASPADLTVDWVDAPAAVALGGPMDISVTIHNWGAQTARGGYTVQILGPDDRVLYTLTDTPYLGEDETRTLLCTILAPYIPNGLGYIGALVDAHDSVPESDENNNHGEAENRTEVVPRRFATRNAWVFDPAPGANGDRQASPGERVLVGVRLRHDGPGNAEDVTVSLSSRDPHVTVVRTGITYSTWTEGAVRNSTGHVLLISPDATPRDVSIDVTVATGPHVFWDLGDEEEEEDYFDSWDDTVVIPIVTRPPEFVMRNHWVFDPIPGVHRDGVANPGEVIAPRVRLRNLGRAATNVRVALAVDDPDVTVVTGEVAHATWPAASALNSTGLQLAIAPAAAPHDVTVDVHVTADGAGPWQFTFVIPIVIPELKFTRRAVWVFDPEPGGNRNRQANPGERIQPRVRLRNSGPGAATNVQIALSVSDPDVTVVNGTVAHATWDEGVALNSAGFALDIAPDAADHTVAMVFDVTADNGGPWQFTGSFPIVVPRPDFVRRSAWLFDPTPGGNKDGQANPGERVRPRVRLKNVGEAAAQNVQVALSISDPDVTVVVGSTARAAWAVGAADNSPALALDIGSDATARDVSVVVDVTADNGGPWQFSYTFPIVLLPAEFVMRRTWVFDPEPWGDRDGQVSPGETVHPRIRLLNTGVAGARNVRVRLSTDDADVSLRPTEVTHADWPVGEARNNSGIQLTVAADAEPHDTTLVVDVTADNGGPWQFSMAIPIGVGSPRFVDALRLASTGAFSWMFAPEPGGNWSWVSDPEPGGNGDHQVSPGERVHPRMRLTNLGPVAENVVATLVIDDPDVTVVTGAVAHGNWPTAEKRNNKGFVVDIAADATPHEIAAAIQVTADNGGPWRFAFGIPMAGLASPMALFAPEDLDMDGVVSIADILAVAGSLGQQAAAYPRADLDGDGWLGIGDMRAIDAVRADTAPAPPLGRVSPGALVERWLWEARRADDGSPVYRHGIAGLGRLLRELRPSAFALLPNYPNPFNPETWIPFDLATEAHVSVHVYDARGRHVRRIDLGELGVGKYRGRSDAAYWDGRNAVGEPVASGVYVYELRAEGLVDRRRMVVHK